MTESTKKPYKVAVYCSSRNGSEKVQDSFRKAAEDLAQAFYNKSWGLVYGGGTKGLMGAVAGKLSDLGGSIDSIRVSALLDSEGASLYGGPENYGNEIMCTTMHERKARMEQEADAFVALPGGFGTLDEFVEIICWSQINIHSKPIVIFNIDGFYDPFFALADKFRDAGMMPKGTEEIYRRANTVDEVIWAIDNYEAPSEGRLKADWSQKAGVPNAVLGSRDSIDNSI
ncbi:hypothetical protein BZA77DRAFT_239608 [Pyronema omphalodes]|nr:hypothetical protein BZA77DRAFT_239608 [Pyronema omphalodes]